MSRLTNHLPKTGGGVTPPHTPPHSTPLIIHNSWITVISWNWFGFWFLMYFSVIQVLGLLQGRRNMFQIEGAMGQWIGWQERILNSRHSRKAKIVTFWSWWQPFNSFCFQTLSFFSLFPFFLLATQKKGSGLWPPPASPVLPALFC